VTRPRPRPSAITTVMGLHRRDPPAVTGLCLRIARGTVISLHLAAISPRTCWSPCLSRSPRPRLTHRLCLYAAGTSQEEAVGASTRRDEPR
jgi:hypothetical protein